MPYSKNVWIEPQGTHLNRVTKVNETPTSVELIQNPELTNEPTPFSVEWMNNIEQGIYDAHERMDSDYGVLKQLMFQPTLLEMATMRLLPLEGQVITVATYQRLCARMYCGDAKNATADWWYKISNPSDKNSRSAAGAYMVVMDFRGMFPRAAGQNSKYKAANDTLYDGKSVGNFNADVSRKEIGSLNFYNLTDSNSVTMEVSGVFSTKSNNWSGQSRKLQFDIASPAGTTIVNFQSGSGNENAPASLSFAAYITY